MDEYFKEYLGDAVFAQHDGYHVIITTEDSNRMRIALEPAVWKGLLEWHKQALVKFKAMREKK